MTAVAASAWGALCLAAASLCLWAWVDRWLAPPGAEWVVIRWPLTVGLSLGGLTLWMLVVGFWQLNAALALLFPVAAIGLAVAVNRPAMPERLPGPARILSQARHALQALLRPSLAGWIAVCMVAASAVVVGQATYYPFIGDDEISRYAYYARLIFENGRVTDLVRGYPMFMPVAYAFVFFITGQLAEQMARLIPALLSMMTVAATAALAMRWYGARAGWGAALALAACPLHIRWSPDGYIDIPSALYFVLCAYAADVWLERRERRWAALAGVLAGLALWTKQAGFAALAGLGLVFAWAVGRSLFAGRRGEAMGSAASGLLALGLAIPAGGFWYVRNVFFDGWAGAVPGPGAFYYQQANHHPLLLIPFVSAFSDFGWLAAPLFIAGLSWGVVRLRRAAWPLAWAVPYTLLWWWLFSYDPRFLLTVLPFYAVLFGGLVAEVQAPRGRWIEWATVGAVAAIMGMGIFQARLGGLIQWFTAPTASYAERLYRAKGALYPTVEFMRDHLPPEARVLSMDGRLLYYLIDRPLAVNYPLTLAELRHYDYFVVGSWWQSAYAGLSASQSEVALALDDPSAMEVVYAGPGYGLVVYRILK